MQNLPLSEHPLSRVDMIGIIYRVKINHYIQSFSALKSITWM